MRPGPPVRSLQQVALRVGGFVLGCLIVLYRSRGDSLMWRYTFPNVSNPADAVAAESGRGISFSCSKPFASSKLRFEVEVQKRWLKIAFTIPLPLTVFSAIRIKSLTPNGFRRLHLLVEPRAGRGCSRRPGRTGTRLRAPGSEHHLVVVAVMRWFLKSGFLTELGDRSSYRHRDVTVPWPVSAAVRHGHVGALPDAARVGRRFPWPRRTSTAPCPRSSSMASWCL